MKDGSRIENPDQKESLGRSRGSPVLPAVKALEDTGCIRRIQPAPADLDAETDQIPDHVPEKGVCLNRDSDQGSGQRQTHNLAEIRTFHENPRDVSDRVPGSASGPTEGRKIVSADQGLKGGLHGRNVQGTGNRPGPAACKDGRLGLVLNEVDVTFARGSIAGMKIRRRFLQFQNPNIGRQVGVQGPKKNLRR